MHVSENLYIGKNCFPLVRIFYVSTPLTPIVTSELQKQFILKYDNARKKLEFKRMDDINLFRISKEGRGRTV